MSCWTWAPRLEPNHETQLSLDHDPGAGDPRGLSKHRFELLFALSDHVPHFVSAEMRDEVPAGLSAQVRSEMPTGVPAEVCAGLPGTETTMLPVPKTCRNDRHQEIVQVRRSPEMPNLFHAQDVELLQLPATVFRPAKSLVVDEQGRLLQAVRQPVPEHVLPPVQELLLPAGAFHAVCAAGPDIVAGQDRLFAV